MRLWRRFLQDRRGEMDEAAFVFPVLLLLSIGLVNLAMVGVAAVSAGNAASYGARMGSVAQINAAGVAYAKAIEMTQVVPLGAYSVSVSGSGLPGDLMAVQITYRVPNYFFGLAAWFGVGMPAEFEGMTASYFRQEGW